MPMFYGMHIAALLIFLISFITTLAIGKLYFVLIGSLLAFFIVILSLVQRKKAIDKAKLSQQ